MNSTTRVIITVVLCLGIWLLWMRFFAPKRHEKIGGRRDESSSKTAKRARPAAGEQPQRPASQPVRPGAGPMAMSIEGNQTKLAWPAGNAELVFTTTGGALRHAVLNNPRYKEVRAGKLQQVDLVRTEAGKGPWPLVTTFHESDFEVPPRAEFELVERSDGKLRYRWASDRVRVSKQFVLDRERPIVWMTLKVRNLTDRRLKERLEVRLFSQQTGDKAASKGLTNPYPRIPTGLCYANGELHRRSPRAVTGESSGCSAAGCGMGSGPVSVVGDIWWIGSDDRYFLTALVPRAEKERQQSRCQIKLVGGGKRKLVAASLLFGEQRIEPNKAITHKFKVFIGPKDLRQLDAVTLDGKQSSELSQSIEFGWFAVLCRPMLALMRFFQSFLGNWGLAIILLTLVVKALTLYFTNKSMRSMREMQRLKPKIDALREKYKEDKQRLNQEMMALYKLHKVNPLGGCLPMLLQMPIWFALYRTLGNAQELYRAEFFGWIHDLTAPDPFYVLPLAMGVSMFTQQAITPQPLEGTQAKMMKYFMPVMFTFMMLWLPAGLTLYIFINTLLSMIHQWYMNRSDPIKPPAGGTDKTSTGGSSAGRPPTKPKRERAASSSHPAASSGRPPAQRSGGQGGAGRRRKRKRKKR